MKRRKNEETVSSWWNQAENWAMVGREAKLDGGRRRLEVASCAG